MADSEKDFKLADSFEPEIEEGKYTVKGTQTVTSPENDTFTVTKDFYVAANTETLSPDEVFSVYPAPDGQGDFTGTLPFIVLKNRFYPWTRCWTNDVNALQVPWLALIVVSENENAAETDVKYSELAGMKEKDVFFPYDEDHVTTCGKDDCVHILTIPKEIYNAIMPSIEDLAWLTHAKYVNLSATEDSIAEEDGWFSTIIANRFVPSDGDKTLKSTVHLIAVDKYLDAKIPEDIHYVRMISLYHWNVYSDREDDISFVSMVNELSRNAKQVKEKALMPHYLRTGEKTYSLYHSPLVPYESARYDNLGGEEKYTSDGRLIYDSQNGIFDVSYSAAFNLGRLITLSRRAEAEKIVAWRKEQAMDKHLNRLETSIGFSLHDLQEICDLIMEEKIV